MEKILMMMMMVLTIYFILEIHHSLKRSKKTVELINKYWEDKNSEELIDEIYEYLINDRKLTKIMKKYGADRKDINELYKKLKMLGDFRKYNRYVPITSFFYSGALEYLLKHKEDDAKKLTIKMMNYFNI